MSAFNQEGQTVGTQVNVKTDKDVVLEFTDTEGNMAVIQVLANGMIRVRYITDITNNSTVVSTKRFMELLRELNK